MRYQPEPVGIDPNRPSIARVYDAFLNGKNNYEIDREVMARILRLFPGAADIARSNRAFLNRAVRFLVNQTPIEQYLDCGAGLPTAENTHQIVRRNLSDAPVIYVDNDPVVLGHARALLEDDEFVQVIDADIFTPSAVLNHPVVTRHIDFTKPIGLLQVGTLHHLLGDEGPAVMAEYIDALPKGSHVVFSHFYDPGVPELTEVAKGIEEFMHNSPLGVGSFRTEAEILAMLPGLEIVKPNAITRPGIVPCYQWWPDGPQLRAPSKTIQCIAGAVGRKL